MFLPQSLVLILHTSTAVSNPSTITPSLPAFAPNTTTPSPHNRSFSLSTSLPPFLPPPPDSNHRPPSRPRPPYRPDPFFASARATTETLTPELELIDSRIVQPCKELNDICKKIRKSCTKRDHKLIDFDRHNNSLNKLREKKEKSLKDEKNLFTVSRRVSRGVSHDVSRCLSWCLSPSFWWGAGSS